MSAYQRQEPPGAPPLVLDYCIERGRIRASFQSMTTTATPPPMLRASPSREPRGAPAHRLLLGKQLGRALPLASRCAMHDYATTRSYTRARAAQGRPRTRAVLLSARSCAFSASKDTWRDLKRGDGTLESANRLPRPGEGGHPAASGRQRGGGAGGKPWARSGRLLADLHALHPTLGTQAASLCACPLVGIWRRPLRSSCRCTTSLGRCSFSTTPRM